VNRNPVSLLSWAVFVWPATGTMICRHGDGRAEAGAELRVAGKPDRRLWARSPCRLFLCATRRTQWRCRLLMNVLDEVVFG